MKQDDVPHVNNATELLEIEIKMSRTVGTRIIAGEVLGVKVI